MHKFTLRYPNGLSISFNTHTYQEFMQAVVKADCVGKRVLSWLVGHKDLRANHRYSYWNNGLTVSLIKEKV